MRDENETKDVRYHKEEGSGCIKADSVDRNKICDKLDICIDPLDHSHHPTQIVNIVTGVLCSENVDVDQAVTLSMIDDSGEMRICKSKSVLNNKLQAEISKCTAGKPNTFIVDACAILWIIHWPTQ